MATGTPIGKPSPNPAPPSPMTTARKNHYAVPLDCITLDRTRPDWQGSELRLTTRKKCVAHASFDGDWFHTRASYAPGRPPNCTPRESPEPELRPDIPEGEMGGTDGRSGARPNRAQHAARQGD